MSLVLGLGLEHSCPWPRECLSSERLSLALASSIPVLGLEHSCPWPRECLSSERLSLALASDFFCVLGLEPCVLDSTSGSYDIFHKTRLQYYMSISIKNACKKLAYKPYYLHVNCGCSIKYHKFFRSNCLPRKSLGHAIAWIIPFHQPEIR